MVKNQNVSPKSLFLWKKPILPIFFLFPFFGYLPHPTVILTATVTLVLALWLWQKRGEVLPFFASTFDSCIFLLAGVFLISGLLTGGAGALEGIVRALLLLFYFPARDFFKETAQRKSTALTFQFSGGIAAFLGIFQYFSGEAQLKWVDPSRFSDIGGRVTGGFENPNVFSVYLLLILPVSLVLFLDTRGSFLLRLLSAICLLAELLCLVLTWSRGAWLSALVVLTVFFFFFGKQTRRALAIAVLPLMILSFYLPHSVVNRFQSIGNLKETSIRYRLLVWDGVLRMLREHPLGIGLGQARFSERYLPYAVKGTETVIHSHQLLLQILCELGVIGLLLFLAALGSLFFKLLSAKSGSRLCRFGGGLGLLGALTAGLFDNVWYHFGIFCLFWVMAALSASGLSADEKSEKRHFII